MTNQQLACTLAVPSWPSLLRRWLSCAQRTRMDRKGWVQSRLSQTHARFFCADAENHRSISRSFAQTSAAPPSSSSSASVPMYLRRSVEATAAIAAFIKPSTRPPRTSVKVTGADASSNDSAPASGETNSAYFAVPIDATMTANPETAHAQPYEHAPAAKHSQESAATHTAAAAPTRSWPASGFAAVGRGPMRNA